MSCPSCQLWLAYVYLCAALGSVRTNLIRPIQRTQCEEVATRGVPDWFIGKEETLPNSWSRVSSPITETARFLDNPSRVALVDFFTLRRAFIACWAKLPELQCPLVVLKVAKPSQETFCCQDKVVLSFHTKNQSQGLLMFNESIDSHVNNLTKVLSGSRKSLTFGRYGRVGLQWTCSPRFEFTLDRESMASQCMDIHWNPRIS